MTETNIYRSTLQRRSVSESNNDPLNSTVNPQSNPSQFIPPDWAESSPNVSVSEIIDESPYTGPGTPLQSQRNQSKIRIMGVIERFEGLKMEINEWEMLLNCQAVSPVVINQQFDSFTKVIQDLARQALLARVDILMWGEILNYKNKILQIRRNA